MSDFVDTVMTKWYFWCALWVAMWLCAVYITVVTHYDRRLEKDYCNESTFNNKWFYWSILWAVMWMVPLLVSVLARWHQKRWSSLALLPVSYR